MYFSTNPVFGFLVGALSSGKCGSMRMSSNVMPSPSSVCRIKLWTGQNVSSGNASVPSPSWLLTMTNSKSSFSRINARLRNTPFTNFNFSKLSICSSAGSSISVPSRSINNSLFFIIFRIRFLVEFFTFFLLHSDGSLGQIKWADGGQPHVCPQETSYQEGADR